MMQLFLLFLKFAFLTWSARTKMRLGKSLNRDCGRKTCEILSSNQAFPD